MNSLNATRLETLNKDNNDTWEMQMEALLIKTDVWGYINGETVQPTFDDDASSQRSAVAWKNNGAKAKSDLILGIIPSELKLIHLKKCLVEIGKYLSI